MKYAIIFWILVYYMYHGCSFGQTLPGGMQVGLGITTGKPSTTTGKLAAGTKSTTLMKTTPPVLKTTSPKPLTTNKLTKSTTRSLVNNSTTSKTSTSAPTTTTLAKRHNISITTEAKTSVAIVYNSTPSVTTASSGTWTSVTTPVASTKSTHTVTTESSGPYCGRPTINITNGEFNWTTTINGSKAHVVCASHFTLCGEGTIECGEDGYWSSTSSECVTGKTCIRCPSNTDYKLNSWPETNPGELVVKRCSMLHTNKTLSGNVTRKCREDGTWRLPHYDCISQELQRLQDEVNKLLERQPTAAGVENVLSSLSSTTNMTTPLYGGELEKATTMLMTIATVSKNVKVSEKQTQTFIDTASNLLDTKNQKSWTAISDTDEDNKKAPGATKVLNVVDTYATAIVSTLEKSGKAKNRTVGNKNMALRVAVLDKNKKTDIHFPDHQVTEIKTTSSINLKNGGLKGVLSYSAVIYKNLSGILPSKSRTKTDTQQTINSMVLSLTMHGAKPIKMGNPVTIYLEHFQRDLSKPHCSFWNVTINSWDSRGCKLISTNSSVSVCQCTHLTNFAILMSPWTEENVVSKAMDIISTVGCSISLVALVVTVAMHLGLWRFVKSHRTIILINLSVALTLSYIAFLAGVDRTENKDTCTAMAVVLQYIYLVVFFLMLVEGIELTITVMYVFPTASRLRWMLPLGWGGPAVIVGISLGATQMKGYGTEKFCWLSIHDNLIWAFVGPALTVILINTVLLIIIIKKMFGTKTLKMKSRLERAKTGVKSLCMLIPLLGCTWVLGMFYVNEDFAWVQYVFAVCNSLQGLVIFIFNCPLNPQMKVAIQRRKKKYFDSRSLHSSNSNKFSMPRISTATSSFSRSHSLSYDD